MKEYYLQRLYWIFNYTSKNFGYCLLKTLCIVVGLPIYAVMFVVEMVATLINLMFCWIPILRDVIFVICKILITIAGGTFYICILTDLKKYKAAMSETVQYEVNDGNLSDEETIDDTQDDVSNETSDME